MSITSCAKYKNPKPVLQEDSYEQELQDTLDYSLFEDVYFVFIDVLGFKKAFDDIKLTHDEGQTDKFRDVFNYYFDLMNAATFMNVDGDEQCYAGQTSDSLYFYTKRTDYLFEFIKIFRHFNLYAMTKNVFFRGGIAKGTLFTKQKYQFYGDSVIGAYLLERNISHYPIIMVDEKTHMDMSNIPGYDDLMSVINKRHYIKPFVFLKNKTILDIDNNFVLKEVNQLEIKKNITNNKNIFEYDSNNYMKYIFLEEEYNREELSKDKDAEIQ